MDETRLRYFGGSSNHWQGWCRPLDKHDLVDWPINHDDLKKHLNEATKILEIKNKFYDKPITENFNQIIFQSVKLKLRLHDQIFDDSNVISLFDNTTNKIWENKENIIDRYYFIH